MRRIAWLGALVLPLAAGACASIIAFPDVPDLATTDASSDIANDTVDGGCFVPPPSSPPPSCATAGQGRTTCGAGSDSCCESPLVTGGSFSRTYAYVGAEPQPSLADPATVSDFRLDRYEVTVGRFRAFVDAWRGGWKPLPGAGKHGHLACGAGLRKTSGGYESGWSATEEAKVVVTDKELDSCSANQNTWTSSTGANERLPMNCVDVAMAQAFCIWDGGFLPSHAEWEYAAAGGSEHRRFPWGSAPPGSANEYAIYGCNYPSSSGGCTVGTVVNLAPVGTATKGAGRWGQLDLAGNLIELTLDDDGKWTPCVDCVNDFAGPETVLVSSDWITTTTTALAPTFHETGSIDAKGTNVGFRCARPPK